MSSATRLGRAAGRVLALVTLSLGCRTTTATEPAAAAPPVGAAPEMSAHREPARSASSSQGPLNDAERAAGVLWRFHAGAPLDGGAAVGPGGEVYVGSVEGYLHALGPDGAFRWSYTVKGGIIGAPLVGPDGRVFVATTTRRIYAILPNGRRSWTFTSPVPIVTPMAAAHDGAMVYGGGDRHVWAVSSRAGARWRSALSGRVAAGPSVGEKGFPVVVATADGTVSAVNGAWSRWDTSVGGAPGAGPPVVLEDDSVWVVAGGASVLLDAKGHERWRRPGVDRVAADGDRLLAFSGATMVSLDRRGRGLAEQELGARASAAPVSLDGTLFVPCEDGSLRAVTADGVRGILRVAPAPLHAPHLGRAGIVVSAGDGTVVMVDPERMVPAP